MIPDEFDVNVVTRYAMWPASSPEHMSICTMTESEAFGRAFTLWNELTHISVLRVYNVRQPLPVWPGGRIDLSRRRDN